MAIFIKTCARHYIVDLYEKYIMTDLLAQREKNFISKSNWLIDNPDDIEIAIANLFMVFIPAIRNSTTTKDTVYIITTKDGKKDLVYIVYHFGKTSFFWANEAVKEEYKDYKFKYAVEMLKSRQDQALLMSIFEGVLKYFNEVRNNDKELKMDLFYITTKQIKFNERKYGKYVSIAYGVSEYIKNQVKLYDLITPLAIELASEGIDNLREESTKI